MNTNMTNTKKSLIKSLALNENDTGSSEVQIGLLTQKIDKLSSHFIKYKKDKHSSTGLLKAVNRRKKIMAPKNITLIYSTAYAITSFPVFKKRRIVSVP